MVAVGGSAQGLRPLSCGEWTERQTAVAHQFWRDGFSTNAARVWFRWLVQDHLRDDDCDYRLSAASTQLQLSAQVHKIAARVANVCTLPYSDSQCVGAGHAGGHAGRGRGVIWARYLIMNGCSSLNRQRCDGMRSNPAVFGAAQCRATNAQTLDSTALCCRVVGIPEDVDRMNKTQRLARIFHRFSPDVLSGALVWQITALAIPAVCCVAEFADTALLLSGLAVGVRQLHFPTQGARLQDGTPITAWVTVARLS